MMNSKEVKPLSVKGLFSNDQYVIPIYQRNYAWEKQEIEQLIQDIWDYCRTDKEYYYIGSLVVSKRPNGRYEVIDGQQRHTTLSVLLSVLKNEHEFGTVEKTNLSFESRETSSQTLHAMCESGQPDSGEESIVAAYRICKEKLAGNSTPDKGDQENIDITRFCEYLLEKVIILRTEVPKGTDLNHYFEIMNNRGEQLEKHEVLKARFMSALQDNPNEQAAFAMVWDACADMNRFVVMGFEPEKRKALFGDDLKKIASNFNDVFKALVEAPEANQQARNDSIQSEKGLKISDLLTGSYVQEQAAGRKNTENQDEKFASIINFPNFLLHVLRLHRNDNEVTLDDKKLLEKFSKNPSGDEAKGFVVALLQYRFLLDNFVIKREHIEGTEGKWCLKRRKTYETRSSDSYVNTFDDESTNQSLVMIQSMFHVSYPTQNYKYWLTALLGYLYQHKSSSFEEGTALLTFLEKLSDRFFFGRFGKEEKDYDEILNSNNLCENDIDEEKLHQGTGVHNFVFNRLDYLLWKDWTSNESIKVGKLKYIDVNKFTFTFKNSVEHYYPQHPEGSDNQYDGNLDRFGNLCLISQSRNSKLTNLLPQFKRGKENHRKGAAVESLKQSLMMSYEWWGNEHEDHLEEGQKNIEAHEEKMIQLLKQTC